MKLINQVEIDEEFSANLEKAWNKLQKEFNKDGKVKLQAETGGRESITCSLEFATSTYN